LLHLVDPCCASERTSQRKTSKALAADAHLRLENRDHGKASILLLEIGKRWQAG